MLARIPLALAVTSVVAAVVALVPATGAQALVPQQIVSTANKYAPGDITIVEGDTLTLDNVDIATHNVVALDVGATGPLFQSAIVGPGKQAPVFGVSSLTPSVYPFYCTVHEFMTGTITVLAAP